MIKNMKNWLNEAVEEEGTRVIFRDFCKEHFDGDYDSMINWLNENGRTQRVYFIGDNGKIHYQHPLRYWERVGAYKPVYVNVEKIYVEFDNSQSGRANGLIYLDPIDLPKQSPPRIRWYKNGRLE